MIQAITPNIQSQRKSCGNSPARNVAFKRELKMNELDAIRSNNLGGIMLVAQKIGTGEIKAEDGAKAQLEHLLKRLPENKYAKIFLDHFNGKPLQNRHHK